MNSPSQYYILTITCPARSGIIAAVSNYLATQDCYVNKMSQYDDEVEKNFFCRLEFYLDSEKSPSIEALREGFMPIAKQFRMDWQICNKDRMMRVLIMVSKEDHCLIDLLYRKNKGQLTMDITTVVSNHIDLRPIVEREGIRFVYLLIL